MDERARLRGPMQVVRRNAERIVEFLATTDYVPQPSAHERGLEVFECPISADLVTKGGGGGGPGWFVQLPSTETDVRMRTAPGEPMFLDYLAHSMAHGALPVSCRSLISSPRTCSTSSSPRWNPSASSPDEGRLLFPLGRVSR